MTKNELERQTVKLEINEPDDSIHLDSLKSKQDTAHFMSQMILWMLIGGFLSIPFKTYHRRIIGMDDAGNFMQAVWSYNPDDPDNNNNSICEFHIIDWITTKSLLEVAANIKEDSKTILRTNLALNEFKREERT
jgi:hypothetical protein